jgi:hypothetical protein
MNVFGLRVVLWSFDLATVFQIAGAFPVQHSPARLRQQLDHCLKHALDALEVDGDMRIPVPLPPMRGLIIA